MIYTVTFNPSIDYVIFTNDFKIDGLNRATATYKFAGGKGINVSRVLKTLDVESTALGFAGGFPGKFIADTLNNSAIQSNFIEVDEDTRINVKLKTGQETEINAPGPHITSAQFEQLLQQIKNTTSEDIVIVAGSVPSSIPSDAYAQIAQITAQTGAKLVVDAEKELAESVLSYHPLFIKPNKDELEVMFNTTVNSDEDVIKYGRLLVDKGAQSVIVSLGGDGAIYIDKEISIKAVNPQGKVVNTVGSGDSTVAGMVAGIASGLTIEKAFQQAVACGTATAFDEDLATRDAIEKIKSQVTISVLDGE
ncbi:TPA: 1-phosphofructokinase [Staphylococcus aureus]|uniref:Tagatose-6-phosphate kinase n=5 Tax=Staphylococcus TaxID=1279 RepID=A0A2S6DQY7_STAAU|nr:1-phosphofructokinase [Staphylococcus aureus]HDH6211705.1 1-phosphofructokinase [Staphylococcus aureus LTCF-12-55]HDH6224797.1 1-phosphofructokinase [Staphylococcus aureus LTCF-12-46]HDH6264277.1 1-phosphofructokinase [Staphylococcus aureus LTCF-7-30]HDH6422131.1 1-phosphofructokinase [Staphylococcus aureus MRSA-Lux-33]HDH6423695.1 1-phosphofructokinase [Staphylococcus aureus MRSA-Lux-34]HDH6426541.1 1-phosphofructokinase [Staphylococcus aureus MRSA-Lux-32]HDH6428976.1 1-phosphofructokina